MGLALYSSTSSAVLELRCCRRAAMISDRVKAMATVGGRDAESPGLPGTGVGQQAFALHVPLQEVGVPLCA